MELDCSNCRTRLRIDDEHTGQLAYCPSRQTLLEMTGTDRCKYADCCWRPRTAWRLRILDGVTFEPVLPAQLNDWVMQGRVSADCELSQAYADS